MQLRNAIRNAALSPFAMLWALLCLPAPLAIHAQSYSIDYYQFSAPGVGFGGTFALEGSVGQTDTSTMLTGGRFSLSGRFSSIYAIQTSGAPLLTISRSNNLVIVSWPVASSGWILQTNDNLVIGNWRRYLGEVAKNSSVIAPVNGNLFFRLVKP